MYGAAKRQIMAFNAWPADGAPEARDAVHSKLGEMHAGEGEKPCVRIMPARMGRPAKEQEILDRLVRLARLEVGDLEDE
jgi:hypothetical protein